MGDGASEYDVVGAIAAHLLHVGRLSSEISACALGQRPDGVAAHEMCDFGRWLRGMSPKGEDAAHLQICQWLHDELHVEAGEALRLASVERPDDVRATARQLSAVAGVEVARWRIGGVPDGGWKVRRHRLGGESCVSAPGFG